MQRDARAAPRTDPHEVALLLDDGELLARLHGHEDCWQAIKASHAAFPSSEPPLPPSCSRHTREANRTYGQR